MLVVGIGNEFRGDDAAGIEAARRIRTRSPDMRVHWGEPMDLLELLGIDDDLIVIDAVIGGSKPGTIHRVDVTRQPFPAGLHASSHNLGIADVIELARILGRLPAKVRVYGIEAESVSIGGEISPAVSAAIDEIATELIAEFEYA